MMAAPLAACARRCGRADTSGACRDTTCRAAGAQRGEGAVATPGSPLAARGTGASGAPLAASPPAAPRRRRPDAGALLLAGALLVGSALLAGAARAERVDIPLPDGLRLAAHWLPAPAPGARPAIVALHGCGGLYRRDGTRLQARYVDYTARLHAAGVHVLLPDSLGSRGLGPICTVRHGERTVGAEGRRGDVLAALDWLRQRPEVDAARIALLGWSHGASTLLAAIDAGRADHAAVAGAVAFYPGCRAALAKPFSLAAPLLLLLGADDDWTPPAPCESLVARTRALQPEADVVLVTYPDSVHGFDSREPVRLRTDVPNGVNRAGVHQGGNPRARAAALAEMDRFLARILRLEPPQGRREEP